MESSTVLTGEMRRLSVRRLQSELTSQNSRNVKLVMDVMNGDMMDSPVAQTANRTMNGAGVMKNSHVRLIPAHSTQSVRRYAVTPLYGEISAVTGVVIVKV